MMVHRLNIDPTYHLVKQNKWSFVLECQMAIIEEAEKLVKARFIQEVMCPDLLENMVLVKKINEKWCMCIDFIDLNKACLKNSYPLSQID